MVQALLFQDVGICLPQHGLLRRGLPAGEHAVERPLVEESPTDCLGQVALERDILFLEEAGGDAQHLEFRFSHFAGIVVESRLFAGDDVDKRFGERV